MSHNNSSNSCSVQQCFFLIPNARLGAYAQSIVLSVLGCRHTLHNKFPYSTAFHDPIKCCVRLSQDTCVSIFRPPLPKAAYRAFFFAVMYSICRLQFGSSFHLWWSKSAKENLALLFNFFPLEQRNINFWLKVAKRWFIVQNYLYLSPITENMFLSLLVIRSLGQLILIILMVLLSVEWVLHFWSFLVDFITLRICTYY